MARIKTDYVNGGYTFAIDWELVSQDVANNSSQVKATVKLISNGASYTISSSADKTLTLTINGVDYKSTVKAALTGNQQKTLLTKTVTVPHNSDGTKTCSISANLAIQVTLSDVYYSVFTASGSAALTAIPRASYIDNLTGNVTINGTNKLTVNIVRKSSSFTHSVRIKLGDYETTLSNVATQAQFAIPLNWLNAIPNSITGTGTVYVSTYNGSTKIGSTVSASFGVTAPNTIVPSFTDVALQRIDNDVPAAWGIYVQGHSDCTATITGAAGTYGSTIKKYEIEIGDIKGSASTMTANLPTAGTITVKATVTDSRGRTATRSKTITVYPYSTPTLDSINVFRANSSGVEADEGTYIGGKIEFTYSHVGSNAASTSIEYKLPNETEWTYAGAFANGQAFTLGGGNLNIDNSYDIRIGLADSLGWIGKIDVLGTGFTTLDLLKGGRGIAFGKVAESANLADFGFKARFRGGVTVDGGITPDHMKNLKAITQESEIGQYIRLLYFPFRMDNYNSYNVTLAYGETIYGQINGFLDFHLRTLVNRFDVRKLQVRARSGTAAQSNFYADFKDGICSIYWKPATEYARLKMTVFQWAAYENTEIDASGVYVLDGSTVFDSIGSDYIQVTQVSNAVSPGSPSDSQTTASAPAGVINQFAGSTAPEGWLICDGSAVSRSAYSDLFAVIGTRFGTGNGSTTFNLPDMRNRVAIGVSDSHELASSGGEETHLLTSAESGQKAVTSKTESSSHTHSYTINRDASSDLGGINPTGSGGRGDVIRDVKDSGAKYTWTSGNASRTHTHDIAASDATQAHNNMQPYVALNYIISIGG